MKTEDILNIDCRIEENKTKINKFLYKIKPVQKAMGTQKGIVPLEVLEKVLHGINLHYGYSNQGIQTHYEDGKFVFYNCSVLRERNWIGYVYGQTMWEVVAKNIIKVYADILSERKKEDGN